MPFVLFVALRLIVSPACACGEPPGFRTRVVTLLGGIPDLLILSVALAIAFAGVALLARRA